MIEMPLQVLEEYDGLLRRTELGSSVPSDAVLESLFITDSLAVGNYRLSNGNFKRVVMDHKPTYLLDEARDEETNKQIWQVEEETYILVRVGDNYWSSLLSPFPRHSG